MRLDAIAHTGLLSIAIAACGSSSTGVVSGEDAGSASSRSDATTGSHAMLGVDADSSQDSAYGDNSVPSTDAGPADDASPSPADAAVDGQEEGGTTLSVYATFYGWADNSPPGAAIAYPKSGGYPTIHETAGGAGTYADPITFATDKSEFAVGTILYVPFIEKYAIMEDDCAECDSDWTTGHKWHIDLWMNSNGTESTSSLVSCEDQWTRASTSVEVNPPAGRVVATNPLFAPSTNTCRTTP
jgi:hypothetical protein